MSFSNIQIFMFDRELDRTRREIGTRVRRLRRKTGLTQIELAEAMGHSGSSRINQIEFGRVRLYAEELPRLCNALKCSLSDIVGPDACPGEGFENSH
ncbi:MAG: helix-turn-helix transcriptional regulator [Paracoccaceae bacterium]